VRKEAVPIAKIGIERRLVIPLGAAIFECFENKIRSASTISASMKPLHMEGRISQRSPCQFCPLLIPGSFDL
jgi:hypothetical protein